MAEITTLIPTYKRPKLLQRALSSIVNQTYKKIEVHVFDNASGDETKEIVREFQQVDSRIKYTCREKNVGLIQNFCLAVEHVNTPYFHFFADDDYVFPWFYQTALDEFKKHPEAGLSHCRTLLVNAQGKLVAKQFRTPFFEGCFHPPESLLHFAEMLPTWTGTLFHKKVLDSIGGLDASVGSNFDDVFNFKAVNRFSIVLNRMPGAIFSVWKKSCSGQPLKPPWPNSTKTNQIILDEVQLPKHLLQKLKSSLNAHRTNAQRGIWLNALLKRDIKIAKEFHTVLLEQGNLQEALLLSRFLKTCNYVPFASFVFQFLLFTLKHFKKLMYSINAKRQIRNDTQLQECLSEVSLKKIAVIDD